MPQPIKRWLRRLAWTALVCAGLLAAGKWWVGPAVVRWQVNRQLAPYWDGPAEIGQVDLGVLGPTILRDIVLLDRRGQAWATAAEVTVWLSPWPSLSPMVSRVMVQRPELTAWCEAGQCRPPLRKPPDGPWRKHVDLQELRLRDSKLTVRDAGRVVGQWVLPEAVFGRRGEAGELEIAGDEFGPIRCTDLKVEHLVIDDHRVELGRLTGRLAGGRLLAWVRADRDANGVWRASGRAAGVGVDLSRLALSIPGAEKGRVSGLVDFRAETMDPNGLTGQGSAFVEGADLRDAPIVQAVMSRAGLPRPNVLAHVDGEGVFHFRAARVTLDQARMSLPMAAVDVEPGATVNIWTGRIDAVAVVVPFGRVGDLVRRVPLLGLVADLTERLSRFRVRGLWQDCESVDISPAPLSGLKPGTRRFLTDAAASRPASLGQAVRRDLQSLLNAPASAPTSARASRPAPSTAPSR